MRPTARRSDAADSSSAIAGAGAAITALATGVFCDAFASVFARRMPVSARLASCEQLDAGLAACGELVGRRPRGDVHRALVRPAPRLLGRERDDRGEQAQQHVERRLQRGDGRRLLGARLAVRALLDELEVVVAEGPEERLGRPRARGRGRSRRTRGWRSPTTSASSASMLRSTGSVTGGIRAAVEAEDELRRVQHLDREAAADLDLLRVLRVERGVGAEARLDAAQ